MIFLAMLSCVDPKSPLTEGEENDVPADFSPHTGTPNDTAMVQDTAEQGDTSTPQDTDLTPTDGIEVCYLGPQRDHQVCFQTVEWSTDWGSDYQYPDPYQGSEQYAAPIRFLDLQSLSEDQSLAPNFVLGEVMQLFKGRYALFMPHVIEKIQVIRENIGGPLFINSGYRNVTYNASVGGVEHSRHIYGDAVDIDSSVASLEDLQAGCIAQGATFTSVYESHVHCDWRAHELEEAFFDSTIEKRRVSIPHVDASIINTSIGFTAPAIGFDEGEPLRRWYSYNRQGDLLETWVGPIFQPTSAASLIKVTVGGLVERELHMPQ